MPSPLIVLLPTSKTTSMLFKCLLGHLPVGLIDMKSQERFLPTIGGIDGGIGISGRQRGSGRPREGLRTLDTKIIVDL